MRGGWKAASCSIQATFSVSAATIILEEERVNGKRSDEEEERVMGRGQMKRRERVMGRGQMKRRERNG